jgi:hypothetical protein
MSKDYVSFPWSVFAAPHMLARSGYLGDVRYWMNSGKHVLALSFSEFDPIPEVGPGEWCARSCPVPAIHSVPDIRRSSGRSDASRVDISVRGDVVDLATRRTDIH